MSRSVDTAVSMMGRKPELLASMAACRTFFPCIRSFSICPIRITAFVVDAIFRETIAAVELALGPTLCDADNC
jgi:hypothetical protein